MEKEICYITQKEFALDKLIPFASIKKQLVGLIQKDYPDFTSDKFISVDCLNNYRRKYLEKLLKKEHKGINELEKEVLKSIQNNGILSENIEPVIESELTFGERVADRIATFGGSWTFIICFFIFLMSWMLINIIALVFKTFDPYPFILLNLILSCLAAIQAPIIMMSQNRQEQKDRIKREQDYKVNLKAELEIRLLHEKIDHIVHSHNKRLMDIQELQMDYLEDLTKRFKNG